MMRLWADKNFAAHRQTRLACCRSLRIWDKSAFAWARTKTNKMIKVRKGQAPPPISRAEFGERFRSAYFDPAFRTEQAALDRLETIAWDAYHGSRKAPVTRKAGPGFADPDYDTSVEWLETRERLLAAAAKQSDPGTASRVLLICGTSRNDGTCPGEISKTYRLTKVAAETLSKAGVQTDLLDLSLITSDYQRHAGVEGARHALSDWLDWMGLIDAGSKAQLDRFIGYYEPYATSHDALDRDQAVQDEVRNVAQALVEAVGELRAGRLSAPGADLAAPRPK
jgi:hypothetical protein